MKTTIRYLFSLYTFNYFLDTNRTTYNIMTNLYYYAEIN